MSNKSNNTYTTIDPDTPIEITFRRARFFADSTMKQECRLGDPCGFVLDVSTKETLRQEHLACRPVLSRRDTLKFEKGDWLESTIKVETGPVWMWWSAICDEAELRQIESLYALCWFFSKSPHGL